MFRLESYVTSLILSYVDRFIKNFRRQDAQVSLWEGDGMFHNLDLDLEALEKELQLPFTFISGHIHELLIHVPWTRMGSESVSVTINTIECVVKLKPPGSEGKQSPSRSKKSHIEEEVTPPSYMSSIISKILYNVSVTCNNIILKYVEEDIVFSMNVKTLSMFSVNEKWEPEFLDMNPAQFFLRKLMTVTDITICLDKRNASGRIESYLEPLLYRCSMTIRMCRFQPNSKSIKATLTRLDIFCNLISFTLSEPQVTMLMRLLTLAMSLQKKQPLSELQENLLDDESKNSQIMASGSDKTTADLEAQSWSGWIWSWMPSILPQNESDEQAQSPLLTNFSHRLHFGFYIDTLNCTVKLEGKECKSSKRNYQSYMKISLNGCFFNLISINANWLNAQFGVSHMSVEPLGDCCCGTTELDPLPYFSAGRIQDDFLTGSLFRNGSVIPEDLPTEWNAHLIHITETLLLERTPALAIDYLCVVENTRVLDINEEEREIDEEKVLTRIIVGPLVIRVNSGLIHRLQRIHSISGSYDYQPYSSLLTSKQDPSGVGSIPPPKLNEEQLLCLLGGNIPQSVYQCTIFNPVLEIYAASHPPVSSARQRKTSRVQKRVLPGSMNVIPPRFTLEWQCLDAKMISPLRMRQIVHTLLSLQEKLPSTLLKALQTFISVKVIGLGSSLIINSGKSVKILEVNNLSMNLNLADEKLQMKTADILKDLKLEMGSIIITCSKASVIIYYQILTSLMFSNHKLKLSQCLKLIHETSLLTDVQILPGAILLDVNVHNIQAQYVETFSCSSIKFSVDKLQAFIEKLASDSNTCYKAMIFGVPLEPVGHKPIVEIVFQIPTSEEQQYAPILCFVVRHMQMTVDPLFYAWLLYYPNITSHASKKAGTVTSSSGLMMRKISESSLSTCQASKPAAASPTIQQDSALSSSGRETATPSVVTHSTIPKTSEHTVEQSWTERIISKYSIWKGLVISGDISQFLVYFPRTSFEDLRDDKSNPISMEQIIRNYLSKAGASQYSKYAFGSSNHPNSSNLEVVIFKLPSITLRCNGSKVAVMDYVNSLPVKLPDFMWTSDKINFPWNLEIADLHCMTFSNGTDISLLKPVSATCTIAVSTRNTPNDESLSSLALIVHCDVSPITVSISELQVKMLAELLLASFAVYGVLFKSQMSNAARFYTEDVSIPETLVPTPGSEESRSISAPAKDVCKETNRLAVAVEDSSQKVKLTAWFQLVLARFSLIMSTVPSSSFTENLKLVLEVEDVITSIDIQRVYYKIKLKIASSCIQYYTRKTLKHPWKLGKFLGLVMRSHNSDTTSEIPSATAASSSSMPFSEDSTNLSRFLVATLTIASCNHLHSKINDANSPSIFNEVIPEQSFSNDRFITELILKIQPMDFVFSPSIIGKFFIIILPLLNVSISQNVSVSTSPPPVSSEQTVQPQSSAVSNLLRSNLPLLYVDMMNIRLIVPRMFSPSEDDIHDCLVFELDSISAAPQPDNPLSRTSLRPDLYHVAEKHHILHTPGSMVEDRQYQIDIKQIRLNTGFWPEMEHFLKSYQPFDTVSTRALSQPNPAVLWNQGQNPESSTSSSLTLYPIVLPFNVSVIVAPPMFFSNSPILICGSTAEINILSEIKLFWTLNQLKLISNLSAEVSSCIFSKLKMVSHIVSNPYLQVSLQNTQQSDDSVLRRDSGLESIDGDSDGGSFKNKEKSEANTPVKVLYTIHEALSTVQSPSIFSESSQPSAIGLVKQSKFSHIPVEMLLTAKGFSVTLFKDAVTELGQISSDSAEVQPLLFINIVEPHYFMKYYADSYFCQVSIFDFSVKFAKLNHKLAKPMPEESDFVVKFLETAQGERCINGVLPSFFTLKYSQNFSKQPKIEMELGRPIRMNLSVALIDYIRNLSETLIQNHKMAQTSTLSEISVTNISVAFDKNEADELPANVDDADYNVESAEINDASCLRSKLNSFSNVVLNTQQLSAVLYGSELRKVIVSAEKINCSLKVISLLNHSVDRTSLILNLSSFILSVASEGKPYAILLNPWSSISSLTLSWEPWFYSCSKPLTQISMDSNVLSINVCPETVQHFFKVVEEYRQVWKTIASNGKISEKKTIPNCKKVSESHNMEEEQHYNDDLRAGAFQYLDQVATELPAAYQVVFDINGLYGTPSMSWRYPQPRCITRMEVSPVPFKNMQEKHSFKGGGEVECILEYYSDLHGQFIEYTKFKLSENKTQRIYLPFNAPLPITASCWRVKPITVESATSSLIDIRCLAGIIRIDSYYSPTFLPHVQASLSISSIQIEFWNQMKKTYQMLPPLNRYCLDSVIPPDHCFSKLSFESSKIGFLFWENSTTVEVVSTRPRLDVLNYASLAMQCVVEPFSLRASSYFLNDEGYNPHLSLVTNSINVWLGPGVIHSLNVAQQLYNQYKNDGSNDLQLLLTPFIVCNNTNEAIKFGQVGVTEEIILQPLQCHMYSWRSTKCGPNIRVSLTSLLWLWSEPISLTEEKNFFLNVGAEDGQSVTFIVIVKMTSPNITQVTICGQLQLCNLTGRILDCAIVSKKDNAYVDNRLINLSPEMTPPSILQRPFSESSLRLCFPSATEAGSSTWSGLVPIQPQEGVKKSYWLVKIPLKDRVQYRSIWCCAIWDCVKINDSPFYRTLIVLSPLISIRSLLPCKASVQIETPGWESILATVVGHGAEHELDCPGTTHDDHELSFQLEGNKPASSPKVAISYSNSEDRVSPDPSDIPPFDDLLAEVWGLRHKKERSTSDWPFIGEEFNNFNWIQSDQPDTITHIKAKFKSGKYFCNSLLVELKPWALLVNSCGCQISLKCNNTIICSVHNQSIIAPPVIESTFQLSIEIDSMYFSSTSIQLSSDQSFYIPRISGLIPLNSSIPINIDCQKSISFLTISSSQTEEVRVIHVKSSYSISNFSSCNVSVAPLVVKKCFKSTKHVITPSLFYNVLRLPSNSKQKKVTRPLTRWWKLDNSENSNCSELYLIISVNDVPSCPILVPSVNDKQIMPIIFSSIESNTCPNPSIGLIAQVKDNQTFLTIWDQSYPDITIYNNTNFTLIITRISEQRQNLFDSPDWQWVLALASNTSAFYSFSNSTSNFFALAVDDGVSSKEWSEAISLSPCISRLISLPNHNYDVKVTITKCAFMMKVFIESASQSEISARDIRLRLAQSRSDDDGHKSRNNSINIEDSEFNSVPPQISTAEKTSYEMVNPVPCTVQNLDETVGAQSSDNSASKLSAISKANILPEIPGCEFYPSTSRQHQNATSIDSLSPLVDSKAPLIDETSGKLSRLQDSLSPVRQQSSPKVADETVEKRSVEESANLNLTFFLAGLSVNFIKDDFVCAEKEVAAFSFDHISFVILPLSSPNWKSSELHVNLSVGGIQLDNQAFNQGGYDFPVVIVKTIDDRQQVFSSSDLKHQSAQWLVEEARMKGQIALFVNSVVDVSTYNSFVIEDISVNISSFQAYIEDTYFLFLKKYLETLTKWTPSSKVIESEQTEGFLKSTSSRGKSEVQKSNGESSCTKKSNVLNIKSQVENVEKTSDISYNVSSNGSETSGVKPLDKEPMVKPLTSSSQSQNMESMDEIIFNFGGVATVSSFNAGDNRNVLSILEFQSDEDVKKEVPLSTNIVALSREIAIPLRLRSLKISPVNILVSVHTSTKFYIALDHSPLSFSEFKRYDLVTSHFRLGSAVSLHYFLNAIYGTGWALGALELWGAPGGLARSVGAGVRDLITMPITGSIEQGARGFLVGIAHGCASLMKHVTAGTLSSVTKFAASWARTLDRLTLEPEDLMHAEELRRLRPQGVAQGFVQGLTEFGISLLGAIGGLAHHPLQYAIKDHPNRSFVNCIGLGLVGVITRPLSGAAELVALTGEGLLSGVGWNQIPKAKQQALMQNRIIRTNSSLKYSWKLLQTLEELLYTVEATHQVDDKCYKPVMLILTKKSLYIFDCEFDQQLKVLPLEELFETENQNDPTLVLLRVKSREKQLEEINQARVLEFVRDSQRLARHQSSSPVLSDNSVEESISFFISPENRDHFIVTLNVVKRHCQSKGFSFL